MHRMHPYYRQAPGVTDAFNDWLIGCFISILERRADHADMPVRESERSRGVWLCGPVVNCVVPGDAPEMPKHVLFVDDEPSILGIYEMLQPFLGEDYTVATSADGQQALEMLDKQPADVIVSDLTMPGMNGIELLTETSQRHPSTARVVVSGFADEVTSAKCLMVAHRYLNKPFNPTTLTSVVSSLCDARQSGVNDRIRDYIGR